MTNKQESLAMLCNFLHQEETHDITNSYIRMGDDTIIAGNSGDGLVNNLFEAVFKNEFIKARDKYLSAEREILSEYTRELNDMIIKGAEKYLDDAVSVIGHHSFDFKGNKVDEANEE